MISEQSAQTPTEPRDKFLYTEEPDPIRCLRRDWKELFTDIFRTVLEHLFQTYLKQPFETVLNISRIVLEHTG